MWGYAVFCYVTLYSLWLRSILRVMLYSLELCCIVYIRRILYTSTDFTTTHCMPKIRYWRERRGLEWQERGVPVVQGPVPVPGTGTGTGTGSTNPLSTEGWLCGERCFVHGEKLWPRGQKNEQVTRLTLPDELPDD
jgi:hypothetical protein